MLHHVYTPRPRTLPEAAEAASRPQSGRRPAVWLFGAVVYALVGMAAWQMIHRVPFRWDLFIWAESPFMTNMVKLSRGEPIYTDPSQANSFVYSPGLEYLTYAVLRPLGRHLDVRYCRAVSIGFALGAAGALTWCSAVLAATLAPGLRGRSFALLAFPIAFLILYRNLTSDVPHPDNLYIAHAATTLALVFQAIRRRSLAWATAAVAFAGLGLLIKQVAALSAFGAALALVMTVHRRRGAAAWLAAAAAASTSASLGLLWGPPWGKFYTFSVLTAHGASLEKVPALVSQFVYEYRLLPLGFALLALGCLPWRRRPEAGRLALAYLVVGLAEVAPTVSAYLKPMGAWNNLTVIEAWLAVAFLPPLLAALRQGPAPSTEALAGAAWPARFAGALTSAMALALVLCYAPQKHLPTREHDRYCRTVEGAVAYDLAQGRRVMVAHGTTFLLRKGAPPAEVPLDRANSFLELAVAGRGHLPATKDRIERRYYDVIYLNSDWYPPDVRAAIERNYVEVRKIRGTEDQNQYRYHWGFQGLTVDTRVMRKRS